MTITTDWQQAALYDLEHSSLSKAEIAEKYGRAESTIKKLQLQNQIVRKNPNTRRGPKRRENRLPISRQHHVIGIRLNMDRGAENMRSYADRLEISVPVLQLMENGQHDFRLSQLQKIVEVTKKTLPELMTSFESNLYQGRQNARH